MQLQMNFAAAAPVIPTMTTILLTPDNHDNIWNAAVVISTVLSALPIPIVQQVAAVSTVAIQFAWDVYSYRHPPPAPGDLAGWAEWTTVAMDAVLDSFYQHARNTFRNGHHKDIVQLKQDINSDKTARKLLATDNFLALFKSTFAKHLLNASPYTIYTCASEDFISGGDDFGQSGKRCQGGVPISQKDLKIVHYKTDLTKDAYAFLDAIPDFDWESFFMSKNGWKLKTQSFSCFLDVCTGPHWPIIELKPNEQEWKPTWDMVPAQLDKDGRVRPLIDEDPKLKELLAKIPTDDVLIKDYFEGKATIKQLAEKMLPGVSLPDQLGLSRTKAVQTLKGTLIHMLIPNTVQKLHWSIVPELELLFDVADLVKRRMIQLQIHLTSCINLVPTQVEALLSPQDYASAWNRANNALLIMSLIPTAVGTVAWMTNVFVSQLQRYQEERVALAPKSLDDWTSWMAGQVNAIVDAYYTGMRNALLNSNHARLKQVRDAFVDGAYRVDTSRLIQQFQTKFAQILLQSTKVAVSKCTVDCIEGHPIDGAFYKADLTDTAITFLDNIPIKWKDLFLGTNGWELARGDYTCTRWLCPVFLAKRGICSRCSGVNWSRRVHTSGAMHLNGPVVDSAELQAAKPSTPKPDTSTKADTRMQCPPLGVWKENVAGKSIIATNFTKMDKTLQWVAEQVGVDASYHFGMSAQNTAHPLGTAKAHELMLHDTPTLRILDEGIQLAGAIHERLIQYRIHLASAAATLPDTVRRLFEPKDYGLAWLIVSPFLNAGYYIRDETEAISAAVELVKGNVVDAKLEEQKATIQDIQGWAIYAIKQADQAIEKLYTHYSTVLRNLKAKDLMCMNKLYAAGQLAIQPQVVLKSFRLTITQAILNAHPRYRVLVCTVSSGNACYGGIEPSGDPTKQYKDNLTDDVRDFLAKELQIDWKSFYLGQEGWQLKTEPYTCNSLRVCKGPSLPSDHAWLKTKKAPSFKDNPRCVYEMPYDIENDMKRIQSKS
jgi:hypothetical protein